MDTDEDFVISVNESTDDELTDPESKKQRKRSWQVSSRTSFRNMQRIPHEVLVSFNYSKDKSLEHLKTYPSFNTSYPRALYVPNTLPDRLDPCHKRSRQYQIYNNTIRKHIGFCRNSWSKKRQKSKKLKQKDNHPDLVFRIAEQVASNPDPYFSGRYDWYYTGGNLDAVTCSDTIIHVDSPDLGTLVLSELSMDASKRKMRPKLFYTTEDKKDPEIFEIQSDPSSSSSKAIKFSARQKYSISVYKYKDELKREYFFTQEDIPFISSAFDPHKTNHFVTSDLNKTVALWDVRRSTEEPKQILFNAEISESKKNNNWNCIRSFARDTYAFAGLKGLTLLDSRAPSNNSTHTFGSLGRFSELCEGVCSLCPSEYENMLYVGTTHRIFVLDMRYIGKTIDERFVVLRWVHMLKSSPLILRIHRTEDYELILASSSLSGDFIYCENIKNSESQFTSPCLPYRPPSLQEAYDKARQRGQCLNPESQLKERINRCTTGMIFLKQDGNHHTIFSNSNGDVFSQWISFEEEALPPSEIENSFAMGLWEKDVLKAVKDKKSSLNASMHADCSKMSKVFRCLRLNSVNPEVILDEPKRPLRREKWCSPVNNLYNYTDALAAGILSIWDIDPEKEVPTIKVEREIENNKVMEWLHENPLGLEESVPEPQMVYIPTTSFVSVTGNEDILANLTTAADEMGDITYSKPKEKSRRSRHIPGF